MTRPDEHDWRKDEIFVFGANLRGVHGKGAARFAYDHCGAIWGQGYGLQGKSFAIPTCSVPGMPLTLLAIREWVNLFLEHVRAHPNEKYFLTRIGCGLAGYKDDEIAPMFSLAPENVRRPYGW
mgnify:FL=1